jgi:hypothetical protein
MFYLRKRIYEILAASLLAHTLLHLSDAAMTKVLLQLGIPCRTIPKVISDVLGSS